MPNPAQLRKIFAAARQLSLAEDALRDLVEQVSGQRSVRALTGDDTKRLLDLLVRAGAQPPRKPRGRRTAPNEVLLVTPAQRERIDALRHEIGGEFQRDEYFAGVCRRLIGKSAPARAGEAVKLIEALKRRHAHQQRTASAP